MTQRGNTYAGSRSYPAGFVELQALLMLITSSKGFSTSASLYVGIVIKGVSTASMDRPGSGLSSRRMR